MTTWTALPLLDNHGGAVPWLAFWPEGEKIATVDLGSKEVKVWNVITGELITTLVGFGGWINCVAISPDGKSLVAAGALDRSTGVSSGIVIWDLSTNSIVLKPHAKPGGIESIAYSHDGRFIAGGGSNNGNTFVWDAVTGEIRAILQSPHRGAVTAVTFALDDTLLVTGTANGQEPGEIDIWRPTWNTK